MKSVITRLRVNPQNQRKLAASRWPSEINTLHLPNAWNGIQGALYHLQQEKPDLEWEIACLQSAQKSLAKVRKP